MLTEILTKKEKWFLASKQNAALKNFSVIYKFQKSKNKHKFIYPLRQAGFTKKEAFDLGFVSGRKLWLNCMNQNDRNLGGRPRIKNYLVEKINSFMRSKSTIAANRYLRKIKKNAFYRSLTFIEIYESFPEKHSLSYSAFRSNVGKEFKKSFKASDLCNYCERLKEGLF